MATSVEVARPSGAFVSVKQDGFTIESNTGTEEELRADLGIAAPVDDVAEKAEKFEAKADRLPPQELPTRAKRSPTHSGPRARRESIQAEIDGEIERKRVAKEAADAEEARLTTLREESKRVVAPATRPAPQSPEPPRVERSAVADYDGSDAKDPAPKIEDFANDPSGDPYTAWMIARSSYAARTEWRKQNHTAQQQQQRQQAETVYHGRMHALTEKIHAHTAKDADFQKRIDPSVATYLTWTTPEEVGVPLGDLVMDAPNTTELLIYFSDNKPELARISGLHPLQQAVEFGTIQGMLRAKNGNGEAAKPKPASKAKPITPAVEGMAAASRDDKSDEELSDDEHDNRYRKFRRTYR